MEHARIAGPEDIESLVQIRRSLMVHFGWDAGLDSAEPTWVAALRERLAEGIPSGSIVGVVCENAGETIAGGIAEVVPRLPSPALPDGRIAHISSMYTEPAFRGRGLAREVVRLLREEITRLQVGTIELYAASPEAEALYRSEAFIDRPGGRPMSYAPRAGSSGTAT